MLLNSLNIYRNDAIQEGKPSYFDAENLILLARVLGERRLANSSIWNVLQQEVEGLMSVE